MGTNYYVTTRPPCPTCNRHYESVHLGKSSAGWQFCFAWNDGEHYTTPVELKSWLADKQIRDEYDEVIDHDKFWDLVEAKRDGLCQRTYDSPYRSVIRDDEFEMDGYVFIKGWFS
jgi:hypothetical protein